MVAGLTGIGVDEISRRAERAQRRHARIRNSTIAVLIALMVVATGSAVFAWKQLKSNDAFLSSTLKAATNIVNAAVVQAERYNVPRTATVELLHTAESLFDDMARLRRLTPDLKHRKAWMLIQFARNYAQLGHTDKWNARALASLDLMHSLVQQQPDNLEWLFDLAASYETIGDASVALGNLDKALANYRSGLVIISKKRTVASSATPVAAANRAAGAVQRLSPRLFYPGYAG